MLKTTETRTINAASTIEQKQADGTLQEITIVNMSATVETDGRASVNTYTYEQELLEKNRETVVEDMVAFIKKVYGVEE